jgi:hypothetical protein
VGETLAGLCPDVPEEYPLNLPGRLARELVESVPQFVIVRAYGLSTTIAVCQYRRSAREAARCKSPTRRSSTREPAPDPPA